MSIDCSSDVLGSRAPVVSVGADSFDRGDLVLAGFVDRSWPEFERAARAGLALDRIGGSGVADAGIVDLSGVEPGGVDPGGVDLSGVDPDGVLAAAVAFRRARGLLAGDELRAWLAERGLSMPEWACYLRRLVLRQRSQAGDEDVVAHHSVPDEALAALLPSEIAFDGVLRRCATEAVAWCAAASSPVVPVAGDSTADPASVAAHAREVAASVVGGLLCLDDEAVRARLARLIRLREGYSRFTEITATDRSMLECLDEHKIDWLRFRCLELRIPVREAALEAVLCLREDGANPAEVARLAHADTCERSIEVSGVDPAVASLLLSAERGDVVGPLAEADDVSRLLIVMERVPPSLRDPTLVERARAEVVRAALKPHIDGTVRWHGEL